ncbi:MAG: hypothetical protein KAJ75_08805 [Alphaproteobacteria bacterium]|nr:hypothetical protein [Alphaproteobacteria bacterium]
MKRHNEMIATKSDIIKSSQSIILDYSGVKLEKHRMSSDKFIESITAFNSLIKSISKDIGIKEEQLEIDVKPIKKGCVEIEFVLQAIASVDEYALSGIIGTSSWIIVKTISDKTLNFLKSKKENKNDIKNILENAKEPIDVKIAKNPDNHKYVENLTNCLLDEVDKLEYRIKEETFSISSNERIYYSNPFVSEESEKIETKKKILKLEGLKATEDGWSFTDQETTKKYYAEVLDEQLQELARNEPISEFSQKNLYCTVKEKTLKKEGNKKASIKKYIIDFSFNDDERLFPESEMYSLKS